MNKLSKIAYVEDDADLRFLVKIALETKGDYLVRTYESGLVLLAEIETIQPDLVLLDVCMPRLDGVSLYLKIREIPSLKKIPVVFFTAKSNKQDINYYNSLGVKEIIAKPFNPINLSASLESFWSSLHKET